MMTPPPQTFGSAVATITWELLAPPRPESVMDMDGVPQLGNQVPCIKHCPRSLGTGIGRRKSNSPL